MMSDEPTDDERTRIVTMISSILSGVAKDIARDKCEVSVTVANLLTGIDLAGEASQIRMEPQPDGTVKFVESDWMVRYEIRLELMANRSLAEPPPALPEPADALAAVEDFFKNRSNDKEGHDDD